MKVVPSLSPSEASELIPSGSVVMVGGFGLTGCPVHVLHALAERDTAGLTIITNNLGEPGLGAGRLLRNGQVSRAIGSYFTSNPEAVQAAQEGTIDVDLMPQGSMIEAIRAGGAGLGGFYTPTARGTTLAGDAETRLMDGVEHVFVPALRGDVALIKAHCADTAGNLTYSMTARNFNPSMATACDVVIAEVDEVVPVGDISPEQVVTPGIYVDYLVEAKPSAALLGTSASARSTAEDADGPRMRIARQARAHLSRGDVVNLGVGIPTLIADLISPSDGIALHTENGLLGVGPGPDDGSALDYPTNAAKQPVTAVGGAAYFGSEESFGMIRGGHIDVAIMGALQVDESGALANWAVPNRPLLGVGGAMDLAAGARTLVVTMTHTTRSGEAKIVPRVTLPLTAPACVDVIVTELAVFRVAEGTLALTDLLHGASLDQVRAGTTARFEVRLP